MAALYNRTGPASFAYDAGMDPKGGAYRRVAVTLLVPIAAMLLARLPLPGVNTVVFEKLYNLGGRRAYDPAENGIFCLGLHPFITAAILVELLALVIRRWRALRLGGHPQRDRLWTRVLIVALVIVAVQAFFYVRWLRGYAEQLYRFGDLIEGGRYDPFWTAAQTISLIAGTFLFFWLTRVIDRYGAGNGFAVMLGGFMVEQLAGELPPLSDTLYRPTTMLPFWLAVVAVLGVTRLASGRPLKSTAPPPGTARLPMPASGLSPVVDGAAARSLPLQIVGFTPFAMPAALMPGTTMNRAIEVAVVGGSCLLLTWLFNRPRLLAQAWKSAGAPDEPDAGLDDRVRAIFARSLALSLAVCWLVMGIEWFCRDARFVVSVVNVTMVACVAMDVVDETNFRRRHGPLVSAWPVHRLFFLPVMLEALEAAGIPAFPRSRRFRTLWNFFAPYVPVDILVPAEHAVPAEMILRARSGVDDQGTRQPMRDVATTTSS
jgi:hypothetical protein